MDHEAYDYEWLEETASERGSQCPIAQRSRMAHTTARLTTSIRLPAPSLRKCRSAGGRHQLRNVALPAHRSHVLRRPVYRLSDLPQLVLPGVRRGIAPVEYLLGTLNTLVLITSSFTMAMGVWCAETRRKKRPGALSQCYLYPGPRLPRHQDDRVSEKIEKHHVPGLPLQPAIVSQSGLRS